MNDNVQYSFWAPQIMPRLTAQRPLGLITGMLVASPKRSSIVLTLYVGLIKKGIFNFNCDLCDSIVNHGQPTPNVLSLLGGHSASTLFHPSELARSEGSRIRQNLGCLWGLDTGVCSSLGSMVVWECVSAVFNPPKASRAHCQYSINCAPKRENTRISRINLISTHNSGLLICKLQVTCEPIWISPKSGEIHLWSPLVLIVYQQHFHCTLTVSYLEIKSHDLTVFSAHFNSVNVFV